MAYFHGPLNYIGTNIGLDHCTPPLIPFRSQLDSFMQRLNGLHVSWGFHVLTDSYGTNKISSSPAIFFVAS